VVRGRRSTLVTWLLEHNDVSAWWLLPVAVGLVLAESVRRETRRSSS
jgi:hypothetical protein